MDNNRISISAIGAIPQEETIYLQIGEATVAITPHIPFEKLVDAIQWSIDFIVGDKPFVSPLLTKVVADLAVINFFTSIDAGLENAYETPEDIYEDYDRLMRFDVIENVESKIDAKQLKFFRETLKEMLNSIDTYRNSAKGIVDSLALDAQKDINTMQQAMDVIGDEEQNKRIANLLEYAQQINPQ